jgi:hypothetical protein
MEKQSFGLQSQSGKHGFSPIYVSYSATSNNLVGDAVLTIAIYLDNQPFFVIDYISVSMSFNANFVQDPIFNVDFLSQGQVCEHAFAPTRVPCTSAAPSGSQFYVLSQRVFFGVDVASNITLRPTLMPIGPIATSARFQISGHLAVQ